MHFRHFLISGLLAGAALFLPDGEVFAENNKSNNQQNVEKASATVTTTVDTEDITVQKDIPAKAENEKALEKKVTVPELNERVKKQPSLKSSQPEATEKAAEALQKLPEQAKGNVKTVLKKIEKTIKAPGPEKVAVGKENKGQVKKKLAPQKGEETKTLPSLYIGSKVKKQDQSLGLFYTNELKGDRSTISKVEDRSEPLLPQPLKKEKAPISQEEIPDVNQVMNSKRTNSSGGPSHDRFSNGLSTINYVDKWYEWNQFYEIQLIQPYLSRYALMNNQWDNAPPAQPPQVAPLLETVNRS